MHLCTVHVRVQCLFKYCSEYYCTVQYVLRNLPISSRLGGYISPSTNVSLLSSSSSSSLLSLLHPVSKKHRSSKARRRKSLSPPPPPLPLLAILKWLYLARLWHPFLSSNFPKCHFHTFSLPTCTGIQYYPVLPTHKAHPCHASHFQSCTRYCTGIGFRYRLSLFCRPRYRTLLTHSPPQCILGGWSFEKNPKSVNYTTYVCIRGLVGIPTYSNVLYRISIFNTIVFRLLPTLPSASVWRTINLHLFLHRIGYCAHTHSLLPEITG